MGEQLKKKDEKKKITAKNLEKTNIILWVKSNFL